MNEIASTLPVPGEEPCPPTIPSRPSQMMKVDGPALVRDDTELLALRARVDRLLAENFLLTRELLTVRDTKDATVERCSELLKDAREGRRLFLALEAEEGMTTPDEPMVAYRALEKWAKKGT